MLSTTSSAPRSCASSASAAMSAMPSSGLVGVSHHSTLVAGVNAARTASRSPRCTGGVLDAPAGSAPWRTAGSVPPYASSGSTTWSPGPQHGAQQRCPRRPARRRTPARARRPRARPGTPPARSGSGWPSGCTRSRRAARRPRPACTSRSGGSARPPTRCSGPAPAPRGSPASRTRTARPCRARLPRSLISGRLQGEQLGVLAGGGHQLVVAALLDQPAPEAGAASPGTTCR